MSALFDFAAGIMSRHFADRTRRRRRANTEFDNIPSAPATSAAEPRKSPPGVRYENKLN